MSRPAQQPMLSSPVSGVSPGFTPLAAQFIILFGWNVSIIWQSVVVVAQDSRKGLLQ